MKEARNSFICSAVRPFASRIMIFKEGGYGRNPEDAYLVFDFVDSSRDGGSEVFHADVNVFHGVVGVWVVENKSFLDLLVMVSELLDLRSFHRFRKLFGG